jgi:hypothetical protein
VGEAGVDTPDDGNEVASRRPGVGSGPKVLEFQEDVGGQGTLGRPLSVDGVTLPTPAFAATASMVVAA